MIVKDLILKQNPDEIIKYMQDNFIEEHENKEDLKVRFQKGFLSSLEDIKNTNPIISDEDFILAEKYMEYWFNDETEEIEEYVDIVQISKSDILNMDTDYEINSFDDIAKHKYPTGYCFMFEKWENILGYNVIEETINVSELEFACAILWELTFFGYTKEKAETRQQIESDELDKRSKEIDEAIKNGEELKTIDSETLIDNLYKELGIFDDMTEEEILKYKEEKEEQRNKSTEKTLEYSLKIKKKEFELLKKIKKKLLNK